MLTGDPWEGAAGGARTLTGGERLGARTLPGGGVIFGGPPRTLAGAVGMEGRDGAPPGFTEGLESLPEPAAGTDVGAAATSICFVMRRQ